MTPVAAIWSIEQSPHCPRSSRRREEETMTNPFIPVLIMFGLAAVLALGGMGASAVLGPKRYNRVKVDAYECGIQPTRHATDIRFPIKYYLVAMSFIIFDIEVIFLYPWAVARSEEHTSELQSRGHLVCRL